MKVKILSGRKKSLLIEYIENGIVKRCYVPSNKVQYKGKIASVDLLTLSQAITFGYPWEDLILSFNSKDFADNLHKTGIWTADDALKNPKGVTGALIATLGFSLQIVLQEALQDKRRK